MRSSAFIGLLGLINCKSATGSWEIVDNAYHSYFNVDGDVAKSLPAETRVELNGKTFNVMLAQSTDGGKTTFVQLDGSHGAKVGDILTLSGGDKAKSSTAPAKSKSASTAGVEGEFSEDVPFSEAVSVKEVKLQVQKEGKPAMVFVTQPWCGACKSLKRSVNGKVDQMRDQMDDFIVVHAAAEDGHEWQAPGESDTYVPRVYFLDRSGDFMSIAGPNKEYKHFFSSAGDLEKAMQTVLRIDSEKDEL